jgi:hypothetical protein
VGSRHAISASLSPSKPIRPRLSDIDYNLDKKALSMVNGDKQWQGRRNLNSQPTTYSIKDTMARTKARLTDMIHG